MGADEITADATAVPLMAEHASLAGDLDSQPLNELGVSLMDQDVLERNVAAQVARFHVLIVF